MKDKLTLVLFYLLLGFFISAPMTPHIQLDLSTMNWANIMVYMWIFFWPIFAGLHVLLWAFLSTCVGVVLLLLWVSIRQ